MCPPSSLQDAHKDDPFHPLMNPNRWTDGERERETDISIDRYGQETFYMFFPLDSFLYFRSEIDPFKLSLLTVRQARFRPDLKPQEANVLNYIKNV